MGTMPKWVWTLIRANEGGDYGASAEFDRQETGSRRTLRYCVKKGYVRRRHDGMRFFITRAGMEELGKWLAKLPQGG